MIRNCPTSCGLELVVWFGCSYIPQLYSSICWVLIKLERLLVSIVVTTVLVNLTIHKDAIKNFEAALSDIGFLLYYKLELYSLKFSPFNLNQLSWKRKVNSAFSTFVKIMVYQFVLQILAKFVLEKWSLFTK